MIDFVLSCVRGRSLVGQFPFHLSELGLDILVLGTFEPCFVPVHGALDTRSRADGVEHVLCRVLVLTTRPSTVPLEVADQCFRVLADFSKVDLFAAFGQQKKTVELREQLRRRLMDRAENGLAVVC